MVTPNQSWRSLSLMQRRKLVVRHFWLVPSSHQYFGFGWVKGLSVAVIREVVDHWICIELPLLKRLDWSHEINLAFEELLAIQFTLAASTAHPIIIVVIRI